MDWILQNQFFIFALLIVAQAGIFIALILNLKYRLDRVSGRASAKNISFEERTTERLTTIEGILASIQPRLNHAEFLSQQSIHKIGFLRYNPFDQTGGDNSFSIALLNEEETGFIITSLYSREGTRLYAKRIEKGKARHHLTDEERRALKIAKGEEKLTL